LTITRCRVIAERICVKKSGVIVTSTSEDSEGSMPSSASSGSRHAWRMFISIGNAIETCTPASLLFCQAKSDMPVM